MKSVVPAPLQDLKGTVGGDAVLFEELLAHGAKVAIGRLGLRSPSIAKLISHVLLAIYKNRVQNWLQEEVSDRNADLNDQADQ